MIFEDVLLPYTKKGQSIERQAMNIREEHRRVLECLGTAYEKSANHFPICRHLKDGYLPQCKYRWLYHIYPFQ